MQKSGFTLSYLFAATLLCAASPARLALAAAGDCFNATFTMQDVGGLKQFKINNADGDQFVTSDINAEQTAVMASAVWNEQTNSTYFKYTGTTTESDPECSEDSVVTYQTSCNRADNNISAKAIGRCPDGSGNNQQFDITIFKKVDDNDDNDCDDAGETRSFGNGTGIGAGNTRDLVGLIAHEFGHVTGLGHCNPTASESTVYCTMITNMVANASWRHVHEWDHKCSATKTKRSLTGYRAQNTTAGALGTPAAFTATGTVTKLMGGLTFDGGTGYQAVAGHRKTSIGWVENPGTGTAWTTLTNPGTNNGVGFFPAHLHETSTTDRVWYSYWADFSVQYGEEAEHLARQIRSTDEFVADQDAEYLYRCLTSSSFLNCSSQTQIRTAHAMSADWLGTTAHSVVAWVNQNNNGGKADNADSHEIWISVGLDATSPITNGDVLGIPTKTGLRTSVAPGLACSENFSSGYDCILAYVPASDMENVVAVARFSVALAAGGLDYAVTLDGTEYVPSASARTANALTAWRNASTDEFFIAGRSSNANQNIFVYSSTVGTSWTLETSNLDSSATAPSAMTGYDVLLNNYIFYSK